MDCSNIDARITFPATVYIIKRKGVINLSYFDSIFIMYVLKIVLDHNKTNSTKF